jgi:hypothetical protein
VSGKLSAGLQAWKTEGKSLAATRPAMDNPALSSEPPPIAAKAKPEAESIKSNI